MLSAGMGCGRIFDYCQAAVAVCASLVLSSFLGNAYEKSGDVSSGQAESSVDGLCVELAASSSSGLILGSMQRGQFWRSGV